jgi:hypothetical protein
MRIPRRSILVLPVAAMWILAPPAHAQLNRVFSDIFSEILDVRLQRSGSPGQHGTHFLESAARANSDLVPALNSLMAGNVSSFPLSSTSSGVLFDFSTGAPVRIAESLGPVFAETAKPLGRGKFLLEVNSTYLELNRFRGLPTESMEFTFTHIDLTGDSSLGENVSESDIIRLRMGLRARAWIGVVFATYGVTNAFDVSVAVPVINVSLRGTATADVNSFTFPRLGVALHLFGTDPANPVFSTGVPYDQSATGIGDVALRLKYTFLRGGPLDFAALVDLRFPTGKAANFLGSGKGSVRAYAIASKRLGSVTPHLNVGYAYRAADLQSDQIEFRAGFDSKLSETVTVAADLLGALDLNSSEAIMLAPGSVRIVDRISTGGVVTGQATRIVPLSNIPDRTNDNTLGAALGFRFAPTEQVNMFANILLPMNDGGLRAQVAPTIGFMVSL